MKDFERPQDLPKTIQEGLATFEGFRRLKFTAEEIFAEYEDAGPHLMMTIKPVGGGGFCFRIGTLEGMTYDEFIETWTMAAVKLNTHSFKQQDLDELWNNSIFRMMRGTILATLAQRGMLRPGATEE